MADALDRDDIITGLRDRRTTGDLDSLHIQPGSDEAVLAAASRVANRRKWSAGWFNFAVEHADSVPTFGRRAVEWETIYDHNGVVIQVASQDALLAMKLRANRPGRDVNDMRRLLALCGVTTLGRLMMSLPNAWLRRRTWPDTLHEIPTPARRSGRLRRTPTLLVRSDSDAGAFQVCDTGNPTRCQSSAARLKT